MTCGIYAILDAATDECLYVGQSKMIEARFRQHVSKLKNRRSGALTNFTDWYHLNGACESSIKLAILEECPNTDADKNAAEVKWFDLLHPRFYGKIPSESERWDHSAET